VPSPSSNAPSSGNGSGKDIALAKQRGAYRGTEKTLAPERAAELVQRAASGIPKSVLASDYGIRRGMVYQYLRQAKPE
jgi:DNA invertase Pin-like site-specific DNA recombinase